MDVISGTTRATFFAVVLAVVLGLLGAVDSQSVADIEHRAQQFRDAGGSTQVITLASGIDGAACDALATVPGVIASGAIRQRDTGVVASSLPGQEVPTYDVSPGFGGFTALGSPTAGNGALLSRDLATTLGLSADHAMTTTLGAVRIATVFRYPSDGRQPGFGYSILIPTASQSAFDSCWMEAWPASDRLTSLLSTALIPGVVSTTPGSGQTPQLSQLNSSFGTSFDGARMFDERLSRFVPELAALVAFLLGFLSVWVRRLELAAARHAGVTAAAQLCQMALEAVVWTALASVISGALLVLVVSVARVADPTGLWVIAAHALAAGAPCGVLGALAAAALVRERRLFVYFRTR